MALVLCFCATEVNATGSTPVDMTLSNVPDPLVLGKSAKIIVTVKAQPPATGIPTGTVDVSVGSPSCTITLPATSCTLTPVDLGDINVIASYSGDSTFAPNGISKVTPVVPPTTTTLTSTPNPSNLGQNVTFSATVNGASPTGSVTFKGSSTVLCANVTLTAGQANCTSASLGAGTFGITAVYSGDSSNGGSTSAALIQNVLATFVNLDQFGLTGSWYNRATSGQGFLLSFYPDLSGPGLGFVAGSWFTFDVAPAGGPEKQRWYTFSGNASTIDQAAPVVIYASVGGNFDAAPKVPATQVGTGTLQFSDCATGSFSYSFTDGSGRNGLIPINRITPNVTCGITQDNGSPASTFLLSGAWYDPNTSGQGLLFDVSPGLNYFAAAWYTFAPNGQAIGGGASQRWYTLQGPLTAGSNTISNIGVYTSTGGIFDDPTKPAQSQVGTATVVFQTCNSATLSYSFSGGSSSGQASTINLQRIGPAPAGCGL